MNPGGTRWSGGDCTLLDLLDLLDLLVAA